MHTVPTCLQRQHSQTIRFRCLTARSCLENGASHAVLGLAEAEVTFYFFKRVSTASSQQPLVITPTRHFRRNARCAAEATHALHDSAALSTLPKTIIVKRSAQRKETGYTQYMIVV